MPRTSVHGTVRTMPPVVAHCWTRAACMHPHHRTRASVERHAHWAAIKEAGAIDTSVIGISRRYQ